MTPENNDTDNEDDREMLVYVDGKVLCSGRTEEEALEYVLKHSPLKIAHKDDCDPICSGCGTFKMSIPQRDKYICGQCDLPLSPPEQRGSTRSLLRDISCLQQIISMSPPSALSTNGRE